MADMVDEVTDVSQNGEQAVILAHFGDKRDGRFLDVGAWSGATLSNTFALAERGWSGVCVEPSPGPFLELAKCHANRPNVHLCNVAVSQTAGLADWHDAGGDALSTLSTSHRDKWGGAAKFRTWTVATVTPAMLFDRFGYLWDVISLDVEGSSASLLLHFPIARMPRLGCVVVEHDSRQDLVDPFMCGLGFKIAAQNAENSIYLR